MKLALATQNRDKIREIEAILDGLDVELVGPDAFPDMPEVVEDGETLEANALKKARAVREFTGLSALADDSGLEVDVLSGAPGVHSSRYAGENATYVENTDKLLRDLEGVPDGERSARFRCVMALALVNNDAGRMYIEKIHDSDAGSDSSKRPDSLVTDGVVEGSIAKSKRGEKGFGYDPVFEVAGKTFAEMTAGEKNLISHRYRALVEMRELMIRLGLANER